MTDFRFATATAMRFGVGSAAGLADEISALAPDGAPRVFLVTGTNRARTSHLTAALDVAGHFGLAAEPTFDDARRAVADARASKADVVVGIGGGAVLDLAKALAILVASDADPLAHAEVIGAGTPLPTMSLPFVAVPTTAGTGSEVTSNSVLTSTEHEVKVSLRSPQMLATLAVIDPELTLSCPPNVTAQSGMDAITQCLEPLTSRFTNPMVEALALAGLRSGGRSLVRAVQHGDDIAARTEVAFCSLMGGLSLANAKLGAVHGLAGTLGGVTGAPHGAICAALLAATTRTNIQAMTAREPDNPALAGYLLAAETLTGELSLDALTDWLDELQSNLASPGLAALGLLPEQHHAVVEQSAKASSMKGNPIELTKDELLEILHVAG